MGGRVWGKCIREEGMMENENGGGGYVFLNLKNIIKQKIGT